MDNEIRRTYDRLAAEYHLIFADWESAVDGQAAILDAQLRRACGRWPLKILDCGCGIGTQALGLAGLGYKVTGVDISAGSIVRACREAQQRGLTICFTQGDLGDLDQVSGEFDVVIAIDNVLPHLVSDTELRAALKSIARKLAPDGVFLASVRDYDEVLKTRPSVLPPSSYDGPNGRRVVYQIWDWLDANIYRFHLHITCEEAGGWTSHHYTGLYRAFTRIEITRALKDCGLVSVDWMFPATTAFYQPMVLARKR